MGDAIKCWKDVQKTDLGGIGLKYPLLQDFSEPSIDNGLSLWLKEGNAVCGISQTCDFIEQLQSTLWEMHLISGLQFYRWGCQGSEMLRDPPRCHN